MLIQEVYKKCISLILSISIIITSLVITSLTVHAYNRQCLAPPGMREIDHKIEISGNDQPARQPSHAEEREKIERAGVAIRSFRNGRIMFDIFQYLANIRQKLANMILNLDESIEYLREDLTNMDKNLSENTINKLTEIIVNAGEFSRQGKLTADQAQGYIEDMEKIKAGLSEQISEIEKKRNDFAASYQGDAQTKQHLLKQFAGIANYMNKIIEMLESRIEIATSVSSRVEHDIIEIITEICQQRQYVTVVNKLTASAKIAANRLTLKSTINNIINNAVDFAEKRQGEKAEVKISLSEEKGFLRIDITDNGPGIPEELLAIDSVMNRPLIYNLNVSQREGGTGLGLTEAWYAIKDAGGTIAVESPSTSLRTGEEGKGTTFTLRLPIGRLGQAIKLPRTGEDATPTRARSSGEAGVRIKQIYDEWKAGGDVAKASQRIMYEALPLVAYSKENVTELEKALEILKEGLEVINPQSIVHSPQLPDEQLIEFVFIKEAIGVLEREKEKDQTEFCREEVEKLILRWSAIKLFFAIYDCYLKIKETVAKIQNKLSLKKDISALASELCGYRGDHAIYKLFTDFQKYSLLESAHHKGHGDSVFARIADMIGNIWSPIRMTLNVISQTQNRELLNQDIFDLQKILESEKYIKVFGYLVLNNLLEEQGRWEYWDVIEKNMAAQGLMLDQVAEQLKAQLVAGAQGTGVRANDASKTSSSLIQTTHRKIPVIWYGVDTNIFQNWITSYLDINVYKQVDTNTVQHNINLLLELPEICGNIEKNAVMLNIGSGRGPMRNFEGKGVKVVNIDFDSSQLTPCVMASAIKSSYISSDLAELNSSLIEIKKLYPGGCIQFVALCTDMIGWLNYYNELCGVQEDKASKTQQSLINAWRALEVNNSFLIVTGPGCEKFINYVYLFADELQKIIIVGNMGEGFEKAKAIIFLKVVHPTNEIGGAGAGVRHVEQGDRIAERSN